MSSKIALIGMGQMGSGMARRLISEGNDVVGYDANTQTRQSLRKEGLAIADSTEQAVAGRLYGVQVCAIGLGRLFCTNA